MKKWKYWGIRALVPFVIIAIAVGFFFGLFSARFPVPSTFGWVNYDQICTYNDGTISCQKANQSRYSTLAGISARKGRVIAIRANIPVIYNAQGNVFKKLPLLPKTITPFAILDDLNTVYIYGYITKNAQPIFYTYLVHLDSKLPQWQVESGLCFLGSESTSNTLEPLKKYLDFDGQFVKTNQDRRFDIENGSMLVCDGNNVRYCYRGVVSTWSVPWITSLEFAGFVDESHILVSYEWPFSVSCTDVLIDCASGRSRFIDSGNLPIDGPAFTGQELALVTRALCNH